MSTSKKRHRLGRVARRLIAKKRPIKDLSTVLKLEGFAGFGDLGKSLESIVSRQPPATDVSNGSFDSALARWIAHLQEIVDTRRNTTFKPENLVKYPNLGRLRVVAMRGPRYVRIVTRDVKDDGTLGGGSAVAFIEKTTGNIYKPAGFKGPTRNFIRGNIYNAADVPRANY